MNAVQPLTAQEKQVLSVLEFVPAKPRCEVRWVTFPNACGLEAEGLVVCLFCHHGTPCSGACWRRTVHGSRGLVLQCVRCKAQAPFDELVVFRSFEVAR